MDNRFPFFTSPFQLVGRLTTKKRAGIRFTMESLFPHGGVLISGARMLLPLSLSLSLAPVKRRKQTGHLNVRDRHDHYLAGLWNQANRRQQPASLIFIRLQQVRSVGRFSMVRVWGAINEIKRRKKEGRGTKRR